MKLVEVLLASKDVTSLEHTAKLEEVQDKEALSTPEEEGEEDVLRGQQVLREQGMFEVMKVVCKGLKDFSAANQSPFLRKTV